jgi:hypothetical protein
MHPFSKIAIGYSSLWNPSKEVGLDTFNPISLLPLIAEPMVDLMASGSVKGKRPFLGRNQNDPAIQIISMLNISPACSTLTDAKKEDRVLQV